jgi:hypothetical protein
MAKTEKMRPGMGGTQSASKISGERGTAKGTAPTSKKNLWGADLYCMKDPFGADFYTRKPPFGGSYYWEVNSQMIYG